MLPKQYNIKPLLIASGILLLIALLYCLLLASKSQVSNIRESDRKKSAEPAVISPAQKEQEERAEKAMEALEEMKKGDRKVPTIMDRERTSQEHEAALKALETMNRPGGSAPAQEAEGGQADPAETTRQQQAALDALQAMQNQ